ncbi:MAG: replication initiator protein [Microvirus sp.]|nr:MAG: replication initiator protein [Microvirus sp.]
MPCYHPHEQAIKGYRDLRVTVPCRNCIGCRLDRAREWQIRLTHESKLHQRQCFVTLTYREDQCPPHGALDKSHFQKFIRRLRKRLRVKTRYYMCGEYGDTTQRPHYHAILFGVWFEDARLSNSQNPNRQNNYYTSKLLDELWSHGDCIIGHVTPESCGYVARYIMKKITGDMATSHYTRVDPDGEIHEIPPPYNAMSLKPGIGHDAFHKWREDFTAQDFVALKGGGKAPLPEYYDRLLERSDPELLAVLKARRQMRAMEPKQVANTRPARLAVREEVKAAQIQTLKRTL